MTSSPKDKAKGAHSKRKEESNDSHNPKKAKKGWTEKHCSLCKKHGGMHTTHNSKECRCYNKVGSHKKAGVAPKPNKPASGKDGMNFAQLIHTKTKKAVRSALKKVNRGKKCRSRHDESDSDSDSDYGSVGSDSTGSLHVVKKTKTSSSLFDTHSCPIKAIPYKIPLNL